MDKSLLVMDKNLGPISKKSYDAYGLSESERDKHITFILYM